MDEKDDSQVFFDSNFSPEMSLSEHFLFFYIKNNYNKYNLFIVLTYEVSKFGKLYTI